jgi:hypothetical protein
MKSSVLGTINWSVNTYQKNSEISLTLIAEKGTFSLGGEYLNELKYHQLDSSYKLPEENTNQNKYDGYKGSMSHHSEIYDNLVEGLKDANSSSNSFDGLRTVEAIEKIYKSAPLL